MRSRITAVNESAPRARDLGIPFLGTPGPLNALTDVAGVTVGHTTLIWGEGPLKVGEGPVRTGVTAILPRGQRYDPVFTSWYALNGNGEMTGTTWIEESGFLEGPVMLTNTHSVGVVRDAVVAWQNQRGFYDALTGGHHWHLPVVAETYDGVLNDINGFYVKTEHVFAALDSASGGPVAEGAVGGGTGMTCFGFKGGIGTASRQVSVEERLYTLGVLVQANHGTRRELKIAGVPIGQELPASVVPTPGATSAPSQEMGSIIVIVATDAPLLPHQLKRLAKRVPMGMARLGSYGAHSSGDIFLAFSTANPNAARRSGVRGLEMLSNDLMTPLFEGTVQGVEEAIVNALVTAKTTTGVGGRTASALPHERVQKLLRSSPEA